MLELEFMRLALATGAVIGLLAPAVGFFLVQRRLSLIGDGIGHVAFAGVALAYLADLPVVPTALVVAVFGALAIEWLRTSGTAAADQALAIVFYVGIAAGVVGVSNIMMIAVKERTKEIGVRMALGAGPGEVTRLVLGRGVVLALTGAGIGVVAALASVRLLGSLLYGVPLADPLAFAAASCLLVVVALAASYLPARRATRLDPLLALRHD